MRGFDYYKVTTVTQAISLLKQYQETAALLAGGSDMLTMMKDRLRGPKLRAPQHLIDIKGIKDLNLIREQKDGLRIGATVTLTNIASSPLVAGRYPLLAQAAGQVAVPQIRNVGTLAGNLCQRPRCWYFRGKLFKDCFRKGGGNCYAPAGENQYHAIFPADSCCMVCSSDLATALTALHAGVEVATSKGTKLIPIEQFYLRPEKNPLRETVLGPAEMVQSVIIPAPEKGSKGIYLKLKEREAFDFAIVNVAAMATLKNDLVSDVRIVLGGVAPIPLRATNAEEVLRGRRVAGSIAAACTAAVEGARPLTNNGYKIKATKGIIEKALTTLA
ncbi:MAG TPA: xanthine dehydrogenase family protein subunit M [Thermodesulfobacteriota bacterium]|nr:xanthine dehydrogenase family protein subunit M [Thermodesulfobacteriota bacterium]